LRSNSIKVGDDCTGYVRSMGCRAIRRCFEHSRKTRLRQHPAMRLARGDPSVERRQTTLTPIGIELESDRDPDFDAAAAVVTVK
jgi:hypothetical protein